MQILQEQISVRTSCLVTPPSMALCDIRPPRMVEVQVMLGAITCPLIPEYAPFLAIHGTTAYRSLPSMAPRHTVHPVHKKAGM